MGRQPKKCPKKCTKHFFSLKPVHYSAFFSRETQLTFCPQNLKGQPNIPKFNRDRKAYTAAFILAADQLKLVNNDQIYQIEHERFKKQNHEQKTQILVPKPRSKSCYCNVCKQIYDDYQQHIDSWKHKQILKSSDFNEDIVKLCQKFGNNLHKLPIIIRPDEILHSFHSKNLNQSLTRSQTQKQKELMFDLEEPDLFLQKSTKQNLEGLNLCRSMKSFHSYCDNYDIKGENGFQNNFLQCSIIKQMNQNCFLQHYGGFKFIQQTASPIKSKFERPIILTAKSFTLDD